MAVNCQVMGIVNVTPDSFSDGGKYFRPEEAVRRAHNLLKEGADIIDLGAESTRPGATPLTWEEEWSRLEPVLRGLSPQVSRGLSSRLSVDTYHPETAERALAMGVKMINCVYVEPVPQIWELCKKFKADAVFPSNFADFAGTVPMDFAGTVPTIYLDPMIGFGTTREEDLARLKSIPELAKRGPVVVGASRKRIVQKLSGVKATGKLLGGNLALVVWAALHGASIVRVHDVAETVQALKVVAALEGADV